VKTFPIAWILPALLTAPLAGSAAAAAAPAPVAPVLWQRLADLACEQAAAPLQCGVSQVARRALTPTVAEYSFTVRIGPGEHDVIGIHRVTRETAPFRPVRSSEGVFFVHGDAWGFDAAFLASAASAAVPDSRALPVFLAENGVDAWGIDLRWALVPAATTDFSFMKDWGMARNAGDVGIGLGIARALRAATGSGLGRLHLLGWSRGGQIGYTYLSAETTVPAPLRQVKGFLPVDIYAKTDVLALRQAACTRLAGAEQRLAQGTYADTSGQLLGTLGVLAGTAPAAPSPIVPGLTNRQAALVAGAATYTFFAGLEPTPSYHFAGGTFDPSGIPTGLTFTEDAYWIDFLSGPSPYEPVKLLADADAVTCGQANVPFDDHYAEVRVPVLYVGADGGFGTYGLYSLSLLGSPDKSSRIVDLRSERALDFGHADIFLARDARAQAWQPILDWVRAH
jgi:hypothetical protein